jgi:hypothetical protein
MNTTRLPERPARRHDPRRRHRYPAEIEAALDEYPTVRSSCVIGLPDEDLGSVPYALLPTDE